MADTTPKTGAADPGAEELEAHKKEVDGIPGFYAVKHPDGSGGYGYNDNISPGSPGDTWERRGNILSIIQQHSAEIIENAKSGVYATKEEKYAKAAYYKNFAANCPGLGAHCQDYLQFAHEEINRTKPGFEGKGFNYFFEFVFVYELLIEQGRLPKTGETILQEEKDRLKELIAAEFAPRAKAEEEQAAEMLEAFEGFYNQREGGALNKLIYAKAEIIPEQLGFMGEAEIQVDKDFKFTVKKALELKNGIPQTARRLLDSLIIQFTKTNNMIIVLPLKEYMEMRGLKDEKTARQQVLRDIEILKLISYEAKEKIKGKYQHSGEVSLYGGTGYIRAGKIYFTFNPTFYKQLLNYRIMEYSKETLKLNPHTNPHAYFFSRYIDENYRINEGKKRVRTISIKTLISKAPELPKYKEVMTTDRAIYRRIIEPVIRDLDSIPRLLYDLIDEADNIIEDASRLTYEQFIRCKIKVDYSEYDKHPERVKARRKHEKKQMQGV